MSKYRNAMVTAMVLGTLQFFTSHAGATLIHTANGKCLDVRGGSFYNRSPLQTYACNYSRAQQFWFQTDYSPYSRPHNASLSANEGGSYGKKWCVDMPYTSDGSNTWIFECWGGSNQKWELDGQLSIRGSLMTIYQPWPGNSQWVSAGPLNAWPSANLTLTRNNELRLPDGRCLDVPWSTADGTFVVAYQCHGGQNQKWYPESNRGLVGLGGMCLTAGNPSATHPLIIRPCLGLSTQQWLFRETKIRGDANKCLTTQVNPQDWQNVFVRTCDGSYQQRWYIDLYDW